MGANDPLRLLGEITSRGWLVGGAVRDKLLGRATSDFDVVLEEPLEPVARALGRAAHGHPFALSEAFGAWRVVSHKREWQVDLLPLAGATIDEDLRQRDFTINAIAERLGGTELSDPLGGHEDLRLRRLRMVSSEAFERDPLRVMRLARLACELGFAVEPRTEQRAAASASGLRGVSPERVFAELKRILSAGAAVAGLELMDSVGATDAVLPELSALRGVEQSRYHHLDVHQHTGAVIAESLELERDPGASFGERAAAVRDFLAQPLADELTRGQALRFGALLHDIAKPRTRAVSAEGRVTFIGHDEQGAELAAAILGRLRASEKLAQHVAALVRNHLRLGFLVHEAPLSRRAVYRYLKACEPVQVDVTLLSVADRLATRGSGAEEAIVKHVALARQLLDEAFAWIADPPRPPLRGDELAGALGVGPGPELGRILRQLEEASFAGELPTRDQALQRARELVAGSGSVGCAE